MSLYHGAAYYPELWDEEVLKDDLGKIRELGLNVLRLGEFSWSRLEQVEGQFDFAWLEETADRLHGAGIKVILGTPTAAPPRWLTMKHPEIRIVENNGRPLIHGSRQNACQNSPVFQNYAFRITEEMARAMGEHPGLLGWQIDNEFLCHVQNCFCESCREKWPHYLEMRYGTVKKLNQAWGTGVWSQEYGSFYDIPLPKATPFGSHNVSLETEYRAFTNFKIISFARRQKNILNNFSDKPVTHNTMPLWHPLDNEELFHILDFPAMDIYGDYTQAWKALREWDWMRTIPAKRRFWVMETAANHPGSTILPDWAGGHHPRGFLKTLAFSSYVSGGEGFCTWLFRGQRSGQEMLHGSLLYPSGKKTTGWTEAEEVETMRRRLEPILEQYRPAPAEIALQYSSRRGHFYFLSEPLEKDFDYNEAFFRPYRTLLDLGCSRDVIFEEGDVSRYKAVVTPYLPCLTETLLEKMVQYVADGGLWITGPLTGYRTEFQTAHTSAILGTLEQKMDLDVNFFEPLIHRESGIRNDAGQTGKAYGWAIGLSPETEGSLGVYEDGPLKGCCWGVKKKLGKGTFVLLGSETDDDFRKETYRRCFEEGGIKQDAMPKGIFRQFLRNDAGKEAEAVWEWRGKTTDYPLRGPRTDLLTGETFKEKLEMEPFAVRFLIDAE